MSTPRARSTSATPTRQQLDELDALLQRMLALPVHAADEEVLDSAPAAGRDELAPTRAASPPPSAERPSPRSLMERPAERPLAERPAAERPVPDRPFSNRTAERPMERTGDPVPQLEKPAESDPNWLSGPYPASYMVVQTVAPLLPPDAPTPRNELEPQVLEPGAAPQTTGGASPPAEPQAEGEWVPLRSSWQPSAQTWKPLAENWAQRQADPPPPEPAPEPAVSTSPVLDPVAGPAAESVPQPSSAGAPAWTPEQKAPLAPGLTPVSLATVPSAAEPPAQSPAPAPAPAPAAGLSIPVVVSPATSTAPAARLPEVTAPARPARQREAYPWYAWPLVLFNDVFDAFLRLWGAPGRWFCGRLGRGFLAVVGVLCLLAALGVVVLDGMGWTW